MYQAIHLGLQGRVWNAVLMGGVSVPDLVNGISQLTKNIEIDPSVDSKWSKLKELSTMYHSPAAYISRGVASASAAATAGLVFANIRR